MMSENKTSIKKEPLICDNHPSFFQLQMVLYFFFFPNCPGRNLQYNAE